MLSFEVRAGRIGLSPIKRDVAGSSPAIAEMQCSSVVERLNIQFTICSHFKFCTSRQNYVILHTLGGVV